MGREHLLDALERRFSISGKPRRLAARLELPASELPRRAEGVEASLADDESTTL
jgi:hypothetical protein